MDTHLETRESIAQRAVLDCRQGDIFSYQDEYYMVISHCCDIAADKAKEPKIEIIKAEILEDNKKNSGFIYGKNPRELHLLCKTREGNVFIKLEQTLKYFIDKKQFLNNYNEEKKYNLPEPSLKLLASWLASRYQRHAFPEQLTPRLKDLQEAIDKVGKKPDEMTGIISLLINIDPWDKELEDDEPYDVELIILYEVDHEDGEKNANYLLDKLDQFKNFESEKLIIKIEVKSDMMFTYRDYRKYTEWRFEHISSRPIIQKEINI